MAEERTAIGPYKILRKLGEGGMGAVYEGVHEAIERRVAIKFLHAEYVHDADVTKRFFNEARAVNRIEHPSLVQISDYGQLADGTTYIVMEYLSGETLSKRLSRLGGKLPLSESLQIAWQIAAALTAVHEKGIVHRDLKPENIMFVADPLIPSGERVKLLDFGIAKLMADVRGTKRGTRSDIIMGTPMYMSPEQCRGAGIVDAKTDVYALGVMLYEMISGTPPFVAEGSGELIGMHLFREPRPLLELAPNLPAPVAALVHRLLVKERDGRPTIRELAAELAQKMKRSDAEPVQAVADYAQLPEELAPTIPYPQRPAVMESPAPQLLAGPEPSAPQLLVGPEPPAAQFPAVPDPPALQLPARPDPPAAELSALRDRPAEPNRSIRASRRWPLLALAAFGVITVAGGQFLRSSRHPAPVQTARVVPLAPVAPPAPKPAVPLEASPSASARPPIAELKAENLPQIIPEVSSAQPAVNPEPRTKSTGENANSFVPAAEKLKMKGLRKVGLAEKAKAPTEPTAATIPIDNSTGNAKPARQAADVTTAADSKKPDDGQKADSSETAAKSGKLVDAQRLYLQKNYLEAMQLAMHSEDPDSVDSLILIGKAACALHTTDIAAKTLNKLRRRPADRILIIEKCSEEGFKYRDGEFLPN